MGSLGHWNFRFVSDFALRFSIFRVSAERGRIWRLFLAHKPFALVARLAAEPYRPAERARRGGARGALYR